MMARKHKSWMLLAFLFLIGSAYAIAPNADYGDAPDGSQAYPGVVGRFPTLYESSTEKMGGHTLTVGQEMIGTTVSAEDDADDLSDPDGQPNLVDTDLDDLVYIQIVAVSIPAPARLAFEVKIDENAPATTRYLNILIDFDKNGSWGGDINSDEWAVKNQKIDIAPGQTQWVTTDWFSWGSGMILPTPVWGRIALTRKPINVNDWKGDGEFEFGEIQDFITELTDSPPPPPPKRGKNLTNTTKKPTCGNKKKNAGEECDGTDDKACPGKCLPNCKCSKPKKDGEGKPTNPGPTLGPCTTPVAYHALVINAGDNSRRKQGMDAADDIFNLLGQQGYDTGQYLAPHWDKEVGEIKDNGITAGGYSTLKGIENAIKKLGQDAKCVDRIMIYIVGHGISEGGSKYGKKWSSGGILLMGKKGAKEVLTPEQLDAWISQYLPECDGKDCKTPQTSCHVSVVVESCHSGNFLGPLSKKGRTVAVSSSKKEVARFGVDENGNSHSGDYTNGYVKDMNSPSTADGNIDGKKDGYVSVAEAHKSATDKLSVAKKGSGTQTPGFFSDECECLPLSCAPKCPNGKLDPDEECDPEADPTGCLSYETCNDDCKCEVIETPEGLCGNEVIDPGEDCDPTAFPTGCQTGQVCDNCDCIGEGINEGCPDGQYPYDDCMSRVSSYQRCVCPNEAVDCCYLQSACNRGEYISEDCDDDCDNGEECIITDADTPCYVCGLPEEESECGPGEYSAQSDCEGDCNGPCEVNEVTSCWYCIGEDVTCEDIDMYSSEKACISDDCDEPSYCSYHDGYGCWYCNRIKVTCGPGLYSDSDCDGECNPTKGESCAPYSDYCYRCVCPDLYVKSLSGSVSKHTSTKCTGGEGIGCTTTCTLTAELSFTIKNSGTSSAGASTAQAYVNPGVGTDSVSIIALDAGKTSNSYSSTLNKEQIVTGTADACSELEWWTNTYNIGAIADNGNSVAECNEDNNENSGQTSSG